MKKAPEELGKETRWCQRGGITGITFELKKGAVIAELLNEEERVCFYVEKGTVELEYSLPSSGKKIIRLSNGDSFYLLPATEYRLQSISKSRIIFIKVSSQ